MCSFHSAAEAAATRAAAASITAHIFVAFSASRCIISGPRPSVVLLYRGRLETGETIRAAFSELS